MLRTVETTPHPLVAAALASSAAPHVVRRHSECPFPILAPRDFARCLARPLDVITKSLFLELLASGQAPAYGVAVCSIPHRVDFTALAKRWNVAEVKLASRATLAEKLGFPPTGVSPLGCEPYPVAMDEAIFAHETILVGGGVAGVEIELAPADLQRICGATRFAFALQ